jgi:hypothetical protein
LHNAISSLPFIQPKIFPDIFPTHGGTGGKSLTFTMRRVTSRRPGPRSGISKEVTEVAREAKKK